MQFIIGNLLLAIWRTNLLTRLSEIVCRTIVKLCYNYAKRKQNAGDERTVEESLTLANSNMTVIR